VTTDAATGRRTLRVTFALVMADYGTASSSPTSSSSSDAKRAQVEAQLQQGEYTRVQSASGATERVSVSTVAREEPPQAAQTPQERMAACGPVCYGIVGGLLVGLLVVAGCVVAACLRRRKKQKAEKYEAETYDVDGPASPDAARKARVPPFARSGWTDDTGDMSSPREASGDAAFSLGSVASPHQRRASRAAFDGDLSGVVPDGSGVGGDGFDADHDMALQSVDEMERSDLLPGAHRSRRQSDAMGTLTRRKMANRLGGPAAPRGVTADSLSLSGAGPIPDDLALTVSRDRKAKSSDGEDYDA
jgi:hypothetical protein